MRRGLSASFRTSAWAKLCDFAEPRPPYAARYRTGRPSAALSAHRNLNASGICTDEADTDRVFDRTAALPGMLGAPEFGDVILQRPQVQLKTFSGLWDVVEPFTDLVYVGFGKRRYGRSNVPCRVVDRAFRTRHRSGLFIVANRRRTKP